MSIGIKPSSTVRKHTKSCLLLLNITNLSSNAGVWNRVFVTGCPQSRSLVVLDDVHSQ